MKLDILFFGVHPDDIELGAAGTVAKHVKSGYMVGIVDLTEGELGTRGTPALRIKEASTAAKIMGASIRLNLKMEDGFVENNKKNQIKIIEVIRKYNPSIVVCNAIRDRHPDHGRSSQLVSDACFLSGLEKIKTNKQQAWRPKAVYHYIQDRFIKPDIVVDISDFMEIKMKAIHAYKSQFHNPSSKEPQTYISSPEFLDGIKGRCIEMGRIIGVKYAEGFTAERYVGVNLLSDLI